jgi:hypothetical protein
MSENNGIKTWVVSFPRSGNQWTRVMLARLMFPQIEWRYEGLNAFTAVEKSHELGRRHNVEKAIYVYRDPRDVCVSTFYFQGRDKRGESFQKFVKDFLVGDVHFKFNWNQHIRHWMIDKPDNVDVMYVGYDELLEDTVGVLTDMTKFIGEEFSASDIQAVVEKSAQDRERIQTGRERQWGRHAKAGVWKAFLTDSQNIKFWTHFGEGMDYLGYEY